MERDLSITAQALTKSVVESTPRAEWLAAIADAVAVYRTAYEQLGGSPSAPGGTSAPTAPPTTHNPSAPSAPRPASPTGADAVGGGLYTVVAVSPKNSNRHARLCLADPGGAESWVGFRGSDAGLACSLAKGDDVTCHVERDGQWLNGSNLRRHNVARF